MVRILRRLLCCIVLLAAVLPLRAQRDVLDSDPLTARKKLVYDMVGVFAGLSGNSQGGTFRTSCDCEFTGGGGTTLTAGLLWERLTKSNITWGGFLSIEGRGVESRFQEVEGLAMTSPRTGQTYTVPVTFRNIAQTRILTTTIAPYVKIEPLPWLFARLGPGFSFVLSGNVSHDKELMSSDVTLPGGEQASVRLANSDGTTVRLEDVEIPGLQRLQISAIGAVGATIRVSKRVNLGPVVQYVLPFTTLSSTNADFTIRSFQFLLEARLIL
ncbi:MAG: hypothetical protein MUC47_06045 [Candidatus Kapabacteria bacterium]|nr:hypothetical protein [Candidatus Kapabacteria bacterium]